MAAAQLVIVLLSCAALASAQLQCPDTSNYCPQYASLRRGESALGEGRERRWERNWVASSLQKKARLQASLRCAFLCDL